MHKRKSNLNFFTLPFFFVFLGFGEERVLLLRELNLTEEDLFGFLGDDTIWYHYLKLGKVKETVSFIIQERYDWLVKR
jgi:hypothetical protein